MKNVKLTGMGVALITPFKDDESVDYDALGKLLDYQIKNGSDFLVILATTAETPTLTEAEKNKIKSYIVDKINGQVPVVLGVGGNCTNAVVEELKTRDLSGIDAILSVVPFYNKPSQEGLYQHYKKIAKASKFPVILYNVPGRTGVNMSAETTLRLANDFENIVAVKEASGNLEQVNEIIKNKPDGFNVLSGDDGMAYPIMTMGGVGVISVIGNAFPKEFSKMIRLCASGEYEHALIIHNQFTELFKLLFADGNPAGVKCLLNAMGFIKNKLRLPLVPTRITTYHQIKKVLDGLNIKY